jgi:hypothetical protein
MIEKALYEHLKSQAALEECLATYNKAPAVFSQEAPADTDSLWGAGPQYGRIVFAEDLQGDPERTMGGTLIVDIMCHKDGKHFPEDIEPIVRELIDGYFFSSGTFTVAAQWKNSQYFTEPKDKVTGCTVAFELLAFPVLTTIQPDVIARLNEWSSNLENLFVINHDPLPNNAWKPSGSEVAIYWRKMYEKPAGWIKDTYATIWRTASVRGHIFAEDEATSETVGRQLVTALYASKRLKKDGEVPIMVNRNNTLNSGADALRTGQLTVEATYGIIVYEPPKGTIDHIKY